MQALGGIGQSLFGAGICTTGVGCAIGLPIAVHGLSNLAEGVGATDGNLVKQGYQAVLGDTAGKVLYYGVDITSAGFSASQKVLSPLGRELSNSGETLFYTTNYIRAYATSLGGAAAINDSVIITKGLYDDYGN